MISPTKCRYVRSYSCDFLGKHVSQRHSMAQNSQLPFWKQQKFWRSKPLHHDIRRCFRSVPTSIDMQAGPIMEWRRRALVAQASDILIPDPSDDVKGSWENSESLINRPCTTDVNIVKLSAACFRVSARRPDEAKTNRSTENNNS